MSLNLRKFATKSLHHLAAACGFVHLLARASNSAAKKQARVGDA
jgi:hypothetical protein